MARLEPLNTESHRLLRVRAAVRDVRIFVPIVASEFAAAAATCPVLFSKSPETGRFYVGAMFGFRPEEPALTAEDAYVPHEIDRQGFFVAGEDIAVDLDNPRISETAGEPLFDDEGQPSVHLRRIQRALAHLALGTDPTDAFIRALLDFKLIEPIDVSLRFDDGETLHLEGLYTLYGDEQGVRVARKHIGWTVRALPGGEALRSTVNRIDTAAPQRAAVNDYFERLAA